MARGFSKRKTNWGVHAGRSSNGSPRGPKRIYVVRRGHYPGIYYSEQKARNQLDGYSGAQWRAFSGNDRGSAEYYLMYGY